MLKTSLKYVLTFIVTMIILIVLLFFSSLIPSKKLEDNVRKSSEFLAQYGEEQEIEFPFRTERLFYFTDALMLNTAYSIDSTHPYEAMLLDRKNYIPGQTQNFHGEIEKHIGTSPNYTDEYGNTFQVAELYGLMHGENIVDSYEYTRYWHGYLIFLRPLLTIISIEGIRNLLFVLTIVLSLVALFLIVKRMNLITAIIYLLSFLAINLYVICNSMNEITTFIIALIAVIFLLLKRGKFKNPASVFLVIGMCTSFFDLLTTPLVTLGLTLPIYVLLNLKDSNKKLYIDCIKICVAWAIGYGLCWNLKWIITDITLGKHILADAISQALYRTGDIIGAGLFDIFKVNLGRLGNYIIRGLFIVLAIYAVIGAVKEIYLKKRKKQQTEKVEILKALIFVIIAIFPFIWYAVLKNHSYVHSFFVYRILIITILNVQIAFTLFMGLQDNLLKEKVQEIPEKTKDINRE